MTIVEILNDAESDSASFSIRRAVWTDLFVNVNTISDEMRIGITAPGTGGGYYDFPWVPEMEDLMADDWEYA